MLDLKSWIGSYGKNKEVLKIDINLAESVTAIQILIQL
jgi:hypothetical protein